jgi:hypothetical protein
MVVEQYRGLEWKLDFVSLHTCFSNIWRSIANVVTGAKDVNVGIMQDNMIGSE